jgi:hypothetical protein
MKAEEPWSVGLSPSSLKELTSAQDRHRASWRKLLAALAAIDSLASDLTAARSDAQRLEARATDQVREYDISAEIPPRWTPAPPEQKLVYLRGLMLSELAFGEPSHTVVNDLANATRDLARAS